MTLKSAFHLQFYWKKFRRDTNTAGTMLPIHEGNQSLRREWRHGQTRDTEVAVAPTEIAQDRIIWVATSTSDAIAMPVAETACGDDFSFGGNDCDCDGIVGSDLILPSLEVGVLSDSRQDYGSDAVVIRKGETAATAANTAEPAADAPPKQRKSRKGPRCAKCGHEYSKNSLYYLNHKGQGKRG